MDQIKNIKDLKNSILKNEEDYDIFIIPIIIVVSMFYAIRAAVSQYYIFGYGDDINWIYWAYSHVGQPSTWLDHGSGYGYRPVYNLIYVMGYSLWGANQSYFYLLNGITFTGAMLFLYQLIKSLSDRLSGLIAVLLFVFLDASFILISKMNFIVTIAEIFFTVSSIYFSINFFKNNDKRFLVMSVILAILAFGTKEPSIIIIPMVNLVYLLHIIIQNNDNDNNNIKNNNQENFTKNTKKTYLAILIILAPVVIYGIITLFFNPEVSISKSTSLLELIKTRLLFYMGMELTEQFKNPYIIFLGVIGSIYFHNFKKDSYNGISSSILKNVIPILIILVVYISVQYGILYQLTGNLMILLLLVIGFIFGDITQRIGLFWFATGFGLILLVSLGFMEPTYLAEPNMGMVIFISVAISKYFKYISRIARFNFNFIKDIREFVKDFNLKYFNPKYLDLKESIPNIVNISVAILIILFQLSFIPLQIASGNDYNKMMADSGKSFKDSVNYLNVNVPKNGTIYYIPDQRHDQFGGQITAIELHRFLCVERRCDIRIKSLDNLTIDNNTTNHPNEYIYLMSNEDLYIFYNYYKYLIRDDIYTSIKKIQNGNYFALILGLK